MTVLVFGGTGLIGDAICDLFYRDIREHTSDYSPIPLGSTWYIGCKQSVQDALFTHEPDVVINAAWPEDYHHLEGFAAVMETTVGHWGLHRIKGCLINIASIYATMTPRFGIYPDEMNPPTADYAAAKAGIVQLTRYWARKVRGSGIRVNAVSPGGVFRDEPQAFVDSYGAHTNHGGMMPAKAVAQACRFLVECPWVTGQNVVVDDGYGL